MPAALLLLVVSVRRSSSGSFRKAALFYFGTPWAVRVAIIKIVYFQNFGQNVLRGNICLDTYNFLVHLIKN